MVDSHKKYAVFTMDLETLIDADCVRRALANYPTDNSLPLMLDGLDRYMELLETNNIFATLFVLKGTAELLSSRLKAYIERGHVIALHGYDHSVPSTMDNESFRRDILEARTTLEQILGVKIHGYRAPCFGIDDSKLKILQELGFTYDASFMPCRSIVEHKCDIDISTYDRIRDGIWRSKTGMFEFGMASSTVLSQTVPLSGGAFLRFAGPLFFNFLRPFVRRNNYYMFYIHPFELSCENIPSISGLRMRDKAYLTHGRMQTYRSCEEIIHLLKNENYEFTTFENLIEIYEHTVGLANA